MFQRVHISTHVFVDCVATCPVDTLGTEEIPITDISTEVSSHVLLLFCKSQRAIKVCSVCKNWQTSKCFFHCEIWTEVGNETPSYWILVNIFMLQYTQQNVSHSSSLALSFLVMLCEEKISTEYLPAFHVVSVSRIVSIGKQPRMKADVYSSSVRSSCGLQIT